MSERVFGLSLTNIKMLAAAGLTFAGLAGCAPNNAPEVSAATPTITPLTSTPEATLMLPFQRIAYDTLQDFRKANPDAKPFEVLFTKTPTPGNYGQCVHGFDGMQNKLYLDPNLAAKSTGFNLNQVEVAKKVTLHEAYHCLAGSGTVDMQFGTFTDPKTKNVYPIKGTYTIGFNIYSDEATAKEKTLPLYTGLDEAFVHYMADASGLFKPGAKESALLSERGAYLLKELESRGLFSKQRALEYYKQGNLPGALQLMSPNKSLSPDKMMRILTIFELPTQVNFADPAAMKPWLDALLDAVK